MNKRNSILIAMLMAMFIPLSMNAFGTTPTANFSTEKRPLAGCDGVTITGGSGSITVAGLGTYSHIQVFTPDFASQVFNQELTTATLTIPIATAGNYIVKVWSNPDPTAFCENNFPVTVGAVTTVLPVANPDNATTPQATPVTIAVLGNDNLNGGTLQMVMLVSNAANGTVSLNASNEYVYTPNAGFSGTDQFTYKIVASNGTSNTTTVTITVPTPQPAPVANPDNATTPKGVAVTIPVLTNDVVNGTFMMLVVMTQPTNGTATVSGNQIVYTPNAGYCGTDNFTYKLLTSTGSSITTVTITVTCPVDPCLTDVTPPVITCPANMSKTPTNGGTCWTNITWSPATATDNCSTPTVTQTAGPASGSCIGFGVSTITYKATDAKGNSAMCSFTVTVVNSCATDVTAPVITCPANMSKTPTNGGTCWTNITWSPATATDNCSTPTVTQTAGPASGSCIGFGVSTITYKATDAKGNSATCSFTVTVVNSCATDVTAPVITCPANMSKTPTNGGTCWTNITWSPATATDNCSTPTVTQTAGPASGSCIGFGVSTITYKATDAKGNSATCSFTVTIVNACATDATPPVITCPANMVKTPTNGGTCWTNITWSPATATDNCSTPTVTQTAGPASGSCIGFGVSTITYKATDAKNNSATCSFTVTINKPTCTNPIVDFKNNTSCLLNLYWINSWGQKVWYKTIWAGSTHSQSTYSGHRWLMCTSTGSVVHDYTANSDCSQTATVSSCSNGWWWLATNDVLTLEAKPEVNRNRIDFVSNTGVQNDYLTVEKANQTSGDFETLEVVNNKSTTNENQYYSVYDNNPVEGDNTYRVKVTYLDGSTKISDTKTVNFKTSQGVSIYPNPAVESVSVDLSKYKGQAVTVSLYNNFGQQVLTQSVDKATGSLNLDIAQFSAGNYRLRVVSKGKKDVVQQLNIAK